MSDSCISTCVVHYTTSRREESATFIVNHYLSVTLDSLRGEAGGINSIDFWNEGRIIRTNNLARVHDSLGDMSCRSKGNHHPRARASRRGQRQASRVSILEPGSKLSWQKECRRSLSRSRIANTDHCRVAISTAHSSKFTRSLGMSARAQKRSRYAYVQGRWRSATIGKIQEAVALTSATEMAGYNHSNPQRVVYHATYPTPLAPSESFIFCPTRPPIFSYTNFLPSILYHGLTVYFDVVPWRSWSYFEFSFEFPLWNIFHLRSGWNFYTIAIKMRTLGRRYRQWIIRENTVILSVSIITLCGGKPKYFIRRTTVSLMSSNVNTRNLLVIKYTFSILTGKPGILRDYFLFPRNRDNISFFYMNRIINQ